jgi:hypothetical protein
VTLNRRMAGQCICTNVQYSAMPLANDDFDEPCDPHAGIALYFLLAGGAGLLAFLTWLLTL